MGAKTRFITVVDACPTVRVISRLLRRRHSVMSTYIQLAGIDGNRLELRLSGDCVKNAMTT